jgi:hypothetical protein
MKLGLVAALLLPACGLAREGSGVNDAYACRALYEGTRGAFVEVESARHDGPAMPRSEGAFLCIVRIADRRAPDFGARYVGAGTYGHMVWSDGR